MLSLRIRSARTRPSAIREPTDFRLRNSTDSCLRGPTQPASNQHPPQPAKPPRKARIPFRRTAGALAGLALLSNASAATSTTPTASAGFFRLDRWGESAGLNLAFVRATAQTTNGYLWFGSPAGLFRYNGQKFRPMEPRPGAHHTTEPQITALAADRQGALWVGTLDEGVYRLAHGRFTALRADRGLSNDRISVLFEDAGGRIWVGTDGGGAFSWDQEHWEPLTRDAEPPLTHPTAFADDGDGGVWIGTHQARLHRLHQSRRISQSLDVAGTVKALHRDRAGTLWVATTGGLLRLRDREPEPVPLVGPDGARAPKVFVTGLASAADGALWVGTLRGLVRIHGTDQQFFGRPDGLGNAVMTSVFVDAEDSLWAGVEIGDLCQLRRSRTRLLRPFAGELQGLNALHLDRLGRLWMAGVEGIAMAQDGQLRLRPGDQGLPRNSVTAIGEDAAGRLWYGTLDGRIGWWADGRSAPVPTESLHRAPWSTTLFFQTTHGAFWIGTTRGLLRRRPDDTLERVDHLDLSHSQVLAMAEDPQGNLWVGTGRGLNRIREEQCEQFTELPDRTIGIVTALHADTAGDLWIGTEDGLWRHRAGQFFAFRPDHGIPRGVGQVLEDAHGVLWLGYGTQILRVPRQDLHAVAEGRARNVHGEWIPLKRPNAILLASGATARLLPTGQGCYATDQGAVFVDPLPVPPISHPPATLLEFIRVNDRQFDLQFADTDAPTLPPFELPPRYHFLELHYVGLSFVEPANVRFRYRVRGLDDAWRDAGHRPVASFQGLPTGEYEFQVQAANRDGLWSAHPASLRFSVLAPWWETLAFRTAFAAALAALGLATGAVYQRRTHNRRRAQSDLSRRLLERQESERRRFAQELHDGLGQDLMIIRNQALLLGPELPSDRTDLRDRVRQIAEVSQQAIEGARSMAHNLRPAELDRVGLTAALRAMMDRAAQGTDLRWEVLLDPLDGALSPADEVQLYRISQELVNNLLKHAHATRATLQLRAPEPRCLELTLSDNGRGFDPERLSSQTPADRGLGLESIRARVTLLGGTFDIQSQPGTGSHFTIRVPRTHPTPPRD